MTIPKRTSLLIWPVWAVLIVMVGSLSLTADAHAADRFSVSDLCGSALGLGGGDPAGMAMAVFVANQGATSHLTGEDGRKPRKSKGAKKSKKRLSKASNGTTNGAAKSSPVAKKRRKGVKVSKSGSKGGAAAKKRTKLTKRSQGNAGGSTGGSGVDPEERWGSGNTSGSAGSSGGSGVDPEERWGSGRTSGSVSGPEGEAAATKKWQTKTVKGSVSGPAPSRDPTRLPPKELVPSPLAVAYGEKFKGEEFFSYLEELDIRATKIYVQWYEIEPENNTWTFELVDALLDQVKNRHDVLISVYSSSEWGAEGVGKGFPPLDQQEYYEFIYNLVEHCQGKIKYWQRDTEPATPKHWSALRAADYVTTQETFYKAVKAADPEATVIGVGHPGAFNGDNPAGQTFYEYLLYHGRDYFDIVDVRLYLDPYTIPTRVQWFKNKMADYGYSKPLVSTEYGGPHPEQFEGYDEVRRLLYEFTGGNRDKETQLAAWYYLDSIKTTLEPAQQMFLNDAPADLEAKHDRIHCRDLVQRTLLALAAGLEKTWYWDLDEHWHPDLGPHPLFGKLFLVDLKKDQRRPIFYVYKKFQSLLAGFTAIERVDTGFANVYLFEIDRGERGDLFVAWEKRDPFDGEDLPPLTCRWTFSWNGIMVAEDLFGWHDEIAIDPNGVATFQLTDTPIFLQEKK